MNNYNCVNIVNKSNIAKIKIEGYIGFPEDWQFDPEYAEQVVSTKEKMRSEIEAITKIKAKSLEIEIDSFGGDVNHGTGIYRAIKSLNIHTKVTYTGWSASAATIIAAAGDEIIAPDNLMLLYHQGSTFAMGGAESLKNTAETLEKVNNQIVDIYMNSGANDRDSIIELMAIENGNGKWITPDEALEFGLITGVTKEFKAAAVKHENFKIFNLPKIENDMDLTSITDSITELKNLILNKKTDEVVSSDYQNKVTELEAQFTSLKDENATLTAEKLTFDNKISEVEAEKTVLIATNATTLTEKDAAIENAVTLKNEFIAYATAKLDRPQCEKLGVDDFSNFIEKEVTEDMKAQKERAEQIMNSSKFPSVKDLKKTKE